MIRFFITAIAVIYGCCSLLAQGTGTVIGKVVEKGSGLPMEYATASLHEAQSGKIEAGCMTDSLGTFKFEKVPVGIYFVECSYIGSNTIRTDTFKVEKGETFDAGTLYVSESTMLSEVVVEGRKSTFSAKLDRKVFNVGQDLMSSAGSASDLMQNIPSVDVDLDGKVSLRGNDNVTILINGKPSAAMGDKTRGDALSQLSASSIERIEVITNPSAQYKPDGTSGIINIVLKKDVRQGLNGSVTANVGSYGRANAGLNLNYGFRNINIFGGYAYRRDRYDRSIDDHRISPTERIDQTTYGLGRPVSHTFRLGMNAYITQNDLLEMSGSYNRRSFRRNERVESQTVTLDDELADFYIRDREAYAKENMWEGNLHYSHSYGAGNEFGIDYAYSSESEDEINHYTTLQPAGETKNDETVWDANYLHHAGLFWNHSISGNIKLMTGYELEHLRAEQNYHVFDWNGNEYVPDNDRTNDFTHYMLLNSLYATSEMQFGKWNILAGVRGEYADIRNDLHSDRNILRQHYFNVFPTLHLSHPVGTACEAMLSYSLRVNRPEGSDMNPFAERINPLSLQAGNPDLKPEKIHSLEAGWLWRYGNGASLLSTLYYRYISNQITEVSRYIDAGVLLTTKENLQSSQNAGVELIWSMPVKQWFDFNLNLNGYYNQIDASKLGFAKRKDTFSWSALLNANFRPLRHYMIQLNARYRSATLVPQGRRDADIRINLGMKYDIPAINLSIVGSVTDLFDTYRKSYTLDTPELKQKVEKRRNPRIFYIGLVWQFGGIKSKAHNANLEYDEGL